MAHAIKDKTEAAYNRTSMVEQRREVMERWAALAYAIVNFSTGSKFSAGMPEISHCSPPISVSVPGP